MSAQLHDGPISDSPIFGGPIPRYLQLADLFRQRIVRGTWASGHRLPSLDELTGEFGLARVTVRQAIDLLAREGLVSRQQGRGTFVTGGPPRERFISVVGSLAELARGYEDTQPKIMNIDEDVGSPPLADGEGTPAPRYAFMRRLHFRDGHAYCVINIYLDERIFRKAPEKFRTKTVIPLLTAMKSVKIAKASQVLTIGTADMEIARLLELQFGAPVAEVRRIFVDIDGTVIYLADVTYRGDAIHVAMDLKP
ncbi:MAG: GntR family transcriptional regulator [Ideonella sp.]